MTYYYTTKEAVAKDHGWDCYDKPNSKVGKFRNELADTCFWTDLDDLVVMDVLHDMYKEETK